ncbi:uncharacterized protein METZ01_LOCUS332271, partial [marine metagenome]
MRTQNVENNKIYIADRLGFSNFDTCLTFPKFIEVETIRACNARCTFCSVYNGSFEAKPKKMEDRLLEKIIDELTMSDATTSTVCACRDGEPLLDRRVANFIQGLKSAGIPTVTLVTNAELLTEKKSMELLSSGLDELMISIDGYSAEVYNKLRIGLDFETVVNNTIAFLALRNRLRSNLKVRIRMVVVDENKEEVEPYLEYWNARVSDCDRVQALPAHSWGNELYIESKASIAKMSPKPCIAPFNMFTIHYDGEVTMCGHDYKHNHVMGDLNNNTISEIWKGERFEDIRIRHLTPGRRDEIEP